MNVIIAKLGKNKIKYLPNLYLSLEVSEEIKEEDQQIWLKFLNIFVLKKD